METNRSFSVGDAFSFAWERYKENLGKILGVALVFAAISLVLGLIENSIDGGMILSLVSMIADAVLYAFWGYFILKITEGKPQDALKVAKVPYINYVAGYFLSGIIMLIGFVALFIPGIYLMVRLSLATVNILDTNVNPADALRNSWNLTKGNFWNIFIFGIISFLVILGGMLLLGVGLLVAIPVVSIAYTHIYKQLSGNAPKVESVLKGEGLES